MYRIHYVATIKLDDSIDENSEYYKDVSLKDIKNNSKEFLSMDISNLIKREFSENCKVDITEHELDVYKE